MRRLEGAHELLDGPLDEQLLAGNLRDLGRFNRWLGGAALSAAAILPLAAGRSVLSVLDVGTGGGDIALRLARHHGAVPDVRLEVAATDIDPLIVAYANRRAAGKIAVALRHVNEEADRSYDVVHASLVLHHVELGADLAAISFLRDMARVARDAVVVNDLDRGWRWWAGGWLLTRVLTRNAYTRHDAPLSVRRAYTANEVVDLARRVDLRLVARYQTRPAYRYALVFVHDRPGT